QVEVRFRRHDGEFRRVLSRVVPMKDATGAVVQWIGTTTDIHDLWMAQQEQQRTNRLLQTISRVQAEFLVQSDTRNVFDQMLTALIDLTESQFGFIAEILYEADGQPYLKSRAIANITWNEETRALYEEHAVTGLEFRNLRTLFGAVITTGAPVIANDPDTDSRRGGLPPGHPPLRAFMGLPIHHSGRLLGMIGVANRVGGYDESIAQQLQPFLHTCGSLIEAVRLDRSRRQAEEALRESQHRFATVLNSIPQGVFWKDRESRYLGCNAVVARAFGYDRPEQLIGKTDHEFPGLTREQADFFIQKDREVMATGQPILGIIEQATLPNGNTIWMETNKMPLRDAQGNVIGILGTWQDITERRRLEEQLRQSQKMEAFGQLASGVAHDFNNVLTVIMGFSEMLLLGLAPDDPQRATVNAIIQAGEQAASLTRQLLSFSRKTVMAPKVVDLNDIVRDTEKMLRRLVAEHVVLALNLDPSLDRVKADPTQLGQVLMNLAVNARDAMPCGGTLTIQTANVILDERQVASLPDLKPGAYVLLKVSDTGHGMAPEVKARIFEPFFTTKSIGKGTGLGLAVVHGIIKQSGGSIHVDSEPGRGTTFNIYLPAVAERAAQTAEAVDQPPAPGTETILLVEDDDGVREFSYRALQMSGYNVIVAMDGIEALSLAERCGKDIAILVTDVVMPGLSGPELADILRSRLPNLRVLFLSGYTDDEVVRHRILHEQAGFLAKPFSPASLAAKVREELVKSSRPVPASLA
ncbi:MAG: PAS domain-containing protein, partial [Nitrospira sp.]|nr:PAS domain-containing protein [Nitrospira sp.]